MSLETLCAPCNSHPKKFISYAWVFSLVLVLIIFIVACIYADKQKGADMANAFAVVWTSLLCLGLSIGGTLVMRKYQTPLAIGYLLGTYFTLFLFFLINLMFTQSCCYILRISYFLCL